MARFSVESIEYIENLVLVEMNRSYFHEPEGIFRTTQGFSMGDNAAARGSEIILRGAEFAIFDRLSRGKLLPIVKKYLRFRDDVSIHLSGNKSDMLKAIKIISTGYPNEILLNMETNVINGKFINYRVYNQVDSNKPFTTVLRKKHCKYNIIPPDSNTVAADKLCEGRTYFHTVRTHCKDEKERARQMGVVETILKRKGFGYRKINLMKRVNNKRDKEVKKHLGKVTYDEVYNGHVFMRNVFSVLNTERYRLPMKVPGVKLKQHIFTYLLDF